MDRVAWYGSNSGKKTHPVGTKAPNGLGLYDMTGKVWGWCQDWYKKTLTPSMLVRIPYIRAEATSASVVAAAGAATRGACVRSIAAGGDPAAGTAT